MGAQGSHPQGGSAYHSGPVVPYGGQQTSVQWSQQQQVGGGASMEAYGSAGPLGVQDPNMVWDEARGGYWVKETVVDQGVQNYDYGGDGYTVYGGRPGKIIKKTTCCDPPEPNIIVHNHKKIVHCDSDDEDITIVTPPPVVVMPPPTNVFVMPCPCPEKPKPSGPSTFFPHVRERSYRMETQTKSTGCMSSPCVGIKVCGPCGGPAPPSCGRCRSYH